jgi:hypothetical protein
VRFLRAAAPPLIGTREEVARVLQETQERRGPARSRLMDDLTR